MTPTERANIRAYVSSRPSAFESGFYSGLVAARTRLERVREEEGRHTRTAEKLIQDVIDALDEGE